MYMTMRWFGTGYDAVTLAQIRQVPGVKGVITTLYGTQPGDVWEREAIAAMKAEVEASGLTIAGIESVNIHDAIKIGESERDTYIDHYITTLSRLGEAGIRLICYNFMAVFDWTRSDLAKPRSDGSTTMSYDHQVIEPMDPEALFKSMQAQSQAYNLAGWEPERLVHIKQLFARYQGVDEEKLFANLVYFLKAILPTCEKYGIKMAIHPDDPAWPVFDLPRIITNKEQLLRLMTAVDNPYNGVTFCTGSLGTNPANDLPGIITALKGRIHFAHVRNLLHTGHRQFEECAHLSSDGSMDIFAIMKALYDTGFDGPIRPDHGRTIWGERGMPGYGLYDRALGLCYLNGLWEALEKLTPRRGSKA
ncbi:MAG: mannonate dehydratase [Spirochaetaceae bacterium]|jgi:mannonate dehydratase|nr:mannonate dehydratase [Spirochaetaceae bacterium]